MTRKPSVDITIPVYNEEKELEKSVVTLRKYFSHNLNDFEWKIIVADNASRDQTLTIAKRLAKLYTNVDYVSLPQKGRGRAVKYVWKKSTADIVAYMDVDLSTDLKHFPPLVESLLRGYDIAIGSRNSRGSRVYGRKLMRTLTSKSYMVLIKLFFWVSFSDAQCGFKAARREVIQALIPLVQDNEWFFDTELLILAEKMGYRIYEEPVTWIDNPGSTVRVLKTAQGDLQGLWRLFVSRPWKKWYGKF